MTFILIIVTLAFVFAFAAIMTHWQRLRCLLGWHLPGEYLGKIKIHAIDRDRHQIDFDNIKQCPVCKKPLGY